MDTAERPNDAAHWVARMDAGDWSAQDEASLQRWLGGDPNRRGLLLRAQASWLAGDQLRAGLPTVAADPAEDDRETEAQRFGWPRRTIVTGLAASVAAVVVGKLVWPGSAVAYATELGEIRRVPLSDGSVMTINSASALDVRLEAKRRLVDLARGEAWFEVAKDARRPFVVAAGGVQVRAIGTAFSVRIRGGDVEVLVTEGVVEAWSAKRGGTRTRLVAGQIALVGAEAKVRRVPDDPSSVDRALAWRGGMIDLQGETLADAAEEFNRYNERKLVIGDDQLAAEQFDGVFRINDPTGFALAVKTSLNVPVALADPAVIRIGG